MSPIRSAQALSIAWRDRGQHHGFPQFLAGKWLELLKQIAPNVTRVAVN
jgi:hypothetical protein